MTKFYVTDMNKTLIVEKSSRQLAALAFKDYFEAKGIEVRPCVQVNEFGFLNNHPVDTDSVFYV